MKGIYGALLAAGLSVFNYGCAVQKDSKLEQKAAVVQKAEQDSYSAKGNQEKVVYLRDQLKAVKKDGVVNPNEISTIETTVARAEQVSKSLKGEDAISKAVKAEAESIAKDGNQYKTDLLNSKQLEVYAVVLYQEQPGNPASSVKAMGVNENDHMKLEGICAEQSTVLGFSAEKAFAKRSTKDSWGYSRDTKLGLSKEDYLRLSKEEIKAIEARQQDFLGSVTWIENPEKLPQYFPGKKLSCSVDADTFSEKRYNDALAKGKILRVGVQYVLRTLEPTKKEKKDKKTEAPKVEAPKAVEAPKIDDAAAKAAAEKAKADSEARAAAERKAAEARATAEKSAAEKAKKVKDLGDIDTYVEK